MDKLEQKLRGMQDIRDEYYAAESAYEIMELELDGEERGLEMLEADLARIPRGRVALPNPVSIPPPPPTMTAPGIIGDKSRYESSDEDDPAPPSPVTLLGISGDRPEDIHPLYQELLEVAGDRKLAEEYAEDIEMHREKILYDLEIELHRKRVRENQGNLISEEELKSLRSSLAAVPPDAAEFEARFGITITEDELEFLRDYDTVSKRARQSLDTTTQTLAHLRSLCLKRGIMRKNASYHEELAIFSSAPDWQPPPHDGNMAIDPPPAAPGTGPSLAHPRFPILLSNPSHTLDLLSPLQALQRALNLPKDDPTGALRRAECMKELGISTLMTKAENTPDYINQWLIHRLRTCPMEAELMLAVCEGVFRVVNLRRWQEEVLYYWRLDEAATDVGRFGGAGEDGTPANGGFGTRGGTGAGGGGGGYGEGLEMGLRLGGIKAGDDDDDDGSVVAGKVNSVIEGEGKVRSEGGFKSSEARALGRARTVRSLG
ncbi:hypothetical protein VTI74DRAFT_7145 [Chaetomium olivicolor]